MLKQKPTRAFWTAYKGLYSNEVPVQVKKRKKPVQEELIEQIKLCTYLDKLGILYYAIPNGGKRNAIEGAKFKRSGVKAGVPDLCIPIARNGYHGLYIELKRRDGGTISEFQKEWLYRLTQESYFAIVANGCDDAIRIIEDYLIEKYSLNDSHIEF